MNKILVILFSVLAINCSSQPPMKFNCGKTDTIYISIQHDTSTNVYFLIAECTGHEHLEWESITIGFVDGEQLEIYRDYGWMILDESKLKTTEFNFVSFDETFFSSACVNIRTKDYFINYFKSVQK